MATGVRINNARNFAGRQYVTEDQMLVYLKSVGALENNKIVFTKGDNTTVQLDLSNLVVANHGIDVTNNQVKIKLDETTEGFLTLSADGLKLSGVQNAINTAVSEASTAINAVIGQSTDAANVDGTLYARIAQIKSDIATLTTEAIGVEGAGAIEVSGEGSTKTISLNLDGATLTQSETGLKTAITLVKLASASEGSASSYQLQDSAGNAIGDKIEVLKDQFLKNVVYTPETHVLQFTFALSNGTDSIADIDLTNLVDVYTASNGVTKVGSDFQGVVDATSENFLTVGANGFKIAGVQNAITTAVEASETELKTAINTAAPIALSEVSVTVPANAGASFSTSVTGRVVAVYDGTGNLIYPDVKYSSGSSVIAAALAADNTAETWTAVVAAPITLA